MQLTKPHLLRLPIQVIRWLCYGRHRGGRISWFGPIKINTVVKRNSNEEEVLDLIERFSNRDIAIRFIEYMDVGSTNGWSMEDVVSAEEIRQLIGELKPIPSVKKE